MDQTTENPPSRPHISATLSLHPTVYSYSSPSPPPTLTLTLTSHHPTPITIYADTLSPALMLRHNAFTITNLSAGGTPVPQTTRTYCRFIPPTKVPVTLDERRFHTLHPSVPYPLSTPFTRPPSDGDTPRPADDLEFGSGRGAYGVDGLHTGCAYVLTLAAGRSRMWWDTVRWWDFGTREEVWERYGGWEGMDARRVKFGAGPHAPIRVDREGVRPVWFWCEA